MQGDRAVKSRARKDAEEIFPIHPPLAQSAVPFSPSLGAFFPVEVFNRDHLQAPRDKMGRDLPGSAAPFRHRMANVEVIPHPSRVHALYDGRNIPNGRAYVGRMVLKA